MSVETSLRWSPISHSHILDLAAEGAVFFLHCTPVLNRAVTSNIPNIQRLHMSGPKGGRTPGAEVAADIRLGSFSYMISLHFLLATLAISIQNPCHL
jgi:hypothetical protein